MIVCTLAMGKRKAPMVAVPSSQEEDVEADEDEGGSASHLNEPGESSAARRSSRKRAKGDCPENDGDRGEEDALLSWLGDGEEEKKKGPLGKKCSLGSPEWRRRLALKFPSGPTSLAELRETPLRQKQAIEARTGYVENLVHNLQEGAEITSDYSGMDFPREC